MKFTYDRPFRFPTHISIINLNIMNFALNFTRSTRLVFLTLLLLLSFGAMSSRSLATPASVSPTTIVIAETLTAEQWMERGNDKYSQDVKGAIEDYTQAIKLDPNNADYYDVRARAYVENNDKVRALADYNQIIKLEPKRSNSYALRAIFYCNEGDYKKGIIDWNQTVKLMPTSVSLSQRGDCRVKMGDHKNAIVDFDQALKLDPKSGDIYNSRALAKLSLGQKQAALQDLNQAAKAYGSGEEYDQIMKSIKELQSENGN